MNENKITPPKPTGTVTLPDLIIHVLLNAGKPVSKSVLLERVQREVDTTPASVTSTITRLMKTGVLIRPRHGYYALSERPPRSRVEYESAPAADRAVYLGASHAGGFVREPELMEYVVPLVEAEGGMITQEEVHESVERLLQRGWLRKEGGRVVINKQSAASRREAETYLYPVYDLFSIMTLDEEPIEHMALDSRVAQIVSQGEPISPQAAFWLISRGTAARGVDVVIDMAFMLRVSAIRDRGIYLVRLGADPPVLRYFEPLGGGALLLSESAAGGGYVIYASEDGEYHDRTHDVKYGISVYGTLIYPRLPPKSTP